MPILKNLRTNDEASVSAIVAVSLGALLAAVALALDISRVIGVKGELQRAADAAALSGARGLYPDDLRLISDLIAPNCARALERAGTTAGQNTVNGGLPRQEDMILATGAWDYANHKFSNQCNSNTNSVQVTLQNNNIVMFFARFFGVSTVNARASATAVMDWIRAVGSGTLPIAVNETYAKSGQVEKITFNPSTSDVGGWFSVPPDTSSASTLESYVENGSCPPIKTGQDINLNNGVITSVLQALAAGLASRGGNWDTVLPVVDSTQFNETKPVKGFLMFRLTEVSATGGDKYVKGIPLAHAIGPGNTLPGGGNYGVLAPPRLVN